MSRLAAKTMRRSAPPARAQRAVAHDELIRNALATTGAPLDRATRDALEPRFGYDFSAVRIHDDSHAAAAAAHTHADAFAVGDDVVFAPRRYAPATAAGRKLLAHELAHTIQQRGARSGATHVEPHSPLEQSAAAAGGSAANGLAVTQPLGSSALAPACALATPNALTDDEIAEQVATYTAKLKNPSYAGRSGDTDWLEQLVATQKQRASLKAPQAKAAAAPPKRRQPTEGEKRQAAVAEAESVAADIEVELLTADVEDEPEPTPMALGPSTPKRNTKPKTAAKRKPKKQRPPSRFDIGGFTDADIYTAPPDDAEHRQIALELEAPRDKRGFEDRVAAAKQSAPGTSLAADFPQSVWNYGVDAGLFAPREQGMVSRELNAPLEKRVTQELAHDRVMAAEQRKEEFEALHNQLDLMFIQAALLGRPSAPALVRGGYAAFSATETGFSFAHAYQTGDYASAAVPLVGGIALGAIAGGVSGPEAPPEQSATGLPEPEEVTADQVRQLYEAEPDAVKKNLSGSFHQLVWERLGGSGQAPMAFRAGRVMQVNELLWPGEHSEINHPDELGATGEKPQDPAATAKTIPDPYAKTLPPEPPKQGTQPSAPPVPKPGGGAPAPAAPAAPAARAAPAAKGIVAAKAVSFDEAIAARKADPSSVYPSKSAFWHEQLWIMSRAGGRTPAAFRLGGKILVDVETLSAEQRAELGL